MKLLITGIDGFVGSHFYKFIKNSDYEVYGTSRDKLLVNNKTIFFLDLKDKDNINRLIQKLKPDYLALIAGFSSLRESFNHSEECLKINYESSKIFLQSIYEQKLNTKVLLISSAMVYSPTQDQITETFPTTNSSPYAHSKLLTENLIREFPSIKIICIRRINPFLIRA